jgi:hypothetical protein
MDMGSSVSEATLRRHVTAPWIVETLEKKNYETALSVDQLRASVKGRDDAADPTTFPGLEVDDAGRVWFTAWHLVAQLF